MENDSIAKRNSLLDELAMEEETENQLIWLYKTLLDMGVENCVAASERDFFKKGMTVLYEESRMHKEVIQSLIKKHRA